MRRLPWVPGPARKAFAAVVAVAALTGVVVREVPLPTASLQAGFGVNPTEIVAVGDPPDAVGKAAAITVYLLVDGSLQASVRPGLPGNPYLAVTQLGVPLTSRELREGLGTAVPRGTRLSAQQRGDELEVWQEQPRRWSRTALAQLACTAETIPGVQLTTFLDLPSRSGRPANHYVSCEQFSDLRP